MRYNQMKKGRARGNWSSLKVGAKNEKYEVQEDEERQRGGGRFIIQIVSETAVNIVVSVACCWAGAVKSFARLKIAEC